ncbi:MAG: TetR/AcrR family transcriptional regulator [Chloroflexota bacterium]|nr:TetR/AcrR family transcriptional regulator [Anaerolineales bacterium]
MIYNQNMSKKNDAAGVIKKRVRRDRKEDILREAIKLFGEHGSQGATLAMIAEAVDLTEPGVLHYFPRKVHLLQGVLEYRDQKDVEKYALLMASEKKDVAEFFEILTGVYAEDEKSPELIQLFIVLVGESIHSEHPSHDFFVERYRRVREVYVQQLSALSEAKIRPDVDLNELATLIMAVIDGLQIQWLLDPEKVNLSATFNLFSKIIVGYLQ